MDINNHINAIVDDFVENLKKDIAQKVQQQVNSEMGRKLSQFDVSASAREYVREAVKSHINEITFPDNSIPGKAVDGGTLTISGDRVFGGTITGFGSTGIQDAATTCQVTILDKGTVFENTLFAPRLEIKGDAIIDGDLIVKGSVPTDTLFFQMLLNEATARVRQNLDQDFHNTFSNTIFTEIKEKGLDLNRITVNGKEVISGKALGSAITESQLQTVGALKELTTTGPTLLAQTLIVQNERVGINTIEPGAVLDIWDQEVQVTLGKYKKNTARLATQRGQSLVISSNEKDTLVCETDGSVTVTQINMGNIQITSAESAPGFESTKGHIVFNSNPTVGGPLGWVCLGGARWANFGLID
jgi:hypothetical protein